MKPLRGRRDQRGMTLLEVLVALMILTATGIPLLQLAQDALLADRHGREQERRQQQASLLLAQATLFPPATLSQWIGAHVTADSLELRVSRRRATVFRLAVRDLRGPDRDILVTLVTTPEVAR